MVSKRESFLIDLIVLLDKYDADFSYTSDDDGVHFEVEGQDTLPGFHNKKELKDRLEAPDVN